MKDKLKKELGILDVFCIASGAMISSGLFILPAIAFTTTGPAIVLSYLLAGLLVLPALLAKAELATAMPKAGGVYFFIERSMGAPMGTIGGLASWFSISFKSAFALIGIGILATFINPGITEPEIKFIAVAFCLFFMIINIIGVRQTIRLEVIIVLGLIAILFFYVVRGFVFISPARYTPFMPYGLNSVFATAGLVFISFGGLTKVCCVAEEVKNPGKNLPLGMFLAFGVVMILYVSVTFVTVGLVDAASLSNSLTPISLGAGTFMGSPGAILLAVAALLAFISTANAGILTASRDAMAMSRDCLIPNIFQRIDAKSKTPRLSIIMTTAFMIMAILFLSLEDLIKTASTLKILLFLSVNLALIIMRESKIQSYRPKFISPCYPWLHIAGILGYAFLVFKMGKIPLSITAIFIIFALAWYFIYARKRVNRQAALIHVIERITAKELVDSTLPGELREIIIERDKIVEDRFDHIIKKCEILDHNPANVTEQTAEAVFKEIAHLLSDRLCVDEGILFDLFVKREKESSTVITPGLAIPHIIVPGADKFDILVVRCKKGIIFPETHHLVETMFVLAGSKDERNFHLRALAAIAQIAQDKDFSENWLKADGIEALRNILLLSERKRFEGR